MNFYKNSHKIKSFFKDKNSDFLWLGAITILASFLRAYFIYHQSLLDRDSILYTLMGKAWYEFGSYQGMIDNIDYNIEWIPPFSIYLLQLAMKIFDNAESAARWTSFLAGICVPLIGYFVAKAMFQQRNIALCTALFMAINPVLIDHSVQPRREIFYLVSCGMVLYSVCKGRLTQKNIFWIIAGAFSAVAIMTRYEAIELLLYMLLYFILSALVFKQYNMTKAIKNYLYYLGGLVAMLILLNLIMQLGFDHWVVYYKHCLTVVKTFIFDILFTTPNTL